jgi:alkylated DNA repair dioxygenase AlkB
MDTDTVADCYLGISGLSYCHDFMTPSEQARVLEAIDELPWCSDLSRRVQHYGYKYNYKARQIDETMRVGQLPEFAVELGQRLVKQGLLLERPDQVIINEYLPGQGIALHIDCEPCFKDGIATISLGSVYPLTLKDTFGTREVQVPLALGSALALYGAARYRWKHGIVAKKSDSGVERGRRVSVTFRSVIL